MQAVLRIGVGVLLFQGMVSLPVADAQAPPPVQPASTSPREATEPAPSPREAAEMRADVMMARKQYSEAIVAYRTLLQAEPKNTLLLNKLGIAHQQLNQLSDAKRYYERAVKADKTYANAINNIGTVHYNRKKYRQAIGQYRRAIELRPDLAAFHSNLGYALFAQKKYEEALLSFIRALQIDPEVFETRGGAGSVLQERSVEDRPFFYFFLAKSYAMQGNAERCAHYLRRARDEGYKGMSTVEKDPAFAQVLKDPQVQEVLHPSNAPSSAQAHKPGVP